MSSTSAARSSVRGEHVRFVKSPPRPSAQRLAGVVARQLAGVGPLRRSARIAAMHAQVEYLAALKQVSRTFRRLALTVLKAQHTSSSEPASPVASTTPGSRRAAGGPTVRCVTRRRLLSHTIASSARAASLSMSARVCSECARCELHALRACA